MKNILFTLLFLFLFCLTPAYTQEFIAIDVDAPDKFYYDPYITSTYNTLALNDGNLVFTQSFYDSNSQ